MSVVQDSRKWARQPSGCRDIILLQFPEKCMKSRKICSLGEGEIRQYEILFNFKYFTIPPSTTIDSGPCNWPSNSLYTDVNLSFGSNTPSNFWGVGRLDGKRREYEISCNINYYANNPDISKLKEAMSRWRRPSELGEDDQQNNNDWVFYNLAHFRLVEKIFKFRKEDKIRCYFIDVLRSQAIALFFNLQYPTNVTD